MGKKEDSPLREIGKQKPNLRAVALLEELLARAKEGSLQGFAMVTVLTGGEYSSGFCFDPWDIDVFGLIGMTEYLKTRLIQESVEQV